ncbi:MAG: hypothetical protein KJ077_22305 [Anaerolineae bacterium]|nr:hypothetical protein [Anaerolineae bacterium]
MNPYDFVRIDGSKTPVRRPAPMHQQFKDFSGQIEGSITTETPLFLPATRLKALPTELKRFITNGRRQVIIPGSSLKGLFRSLVETVGPGCWWLYDGTYRDKTDYSGKLPPAFKQCSTHNQLCPACRMFGLINRGTVLLGQVNFEDAVCTAPVPHPPLYTPVLDAPKPRHRAWYLNQAGDRVAGRKFFFHQATILTSKEFRKTKQGEIINQHIQPIGQGSTFTFAASFNNLAADDLALLLYATVLEPGMRHKIGYAKPAGLGTIRVDLTRLAIIDYTTRYTSPGGGRTVYEGDKLADYLTGQTRAYLNDQGSVTLQDLRRIWAWPPAPGVAYGYPNRAWFNENPGASIAQTKDAPRQV